MLHPMPIDPVHIVETLPMDQLNGWQIMDTFRFPKNGPLFTDVLEATDLPGAEYRDRTLGSPQLIGDNVGNLVSGYTTLAGNTSEFVFSRVGPNGPKSLTDTPPTNFKTEVGGMIAKRFGDKLYVGLVCHELTNLSDRLNIFVVKSYDGWFSTQGPSMVEEGAPLNINDPPPLPTPGGDPSDEYTAKVARAVLNLIKTEYTSNAQGDLGKITQGLSKNGSIDANDYVLTHEGHPAMNLMTIIAMRQILNTNSDLYNSDGLFARLMQTQFQVLER
jgi:hypothetical protein